MRIRLFAGLLLASPLALPQDRSPAPADSALFQELPVVEAASLHTQSLQEAPANVTVISRQEIRRYGYRTLADVLSNVRGFYPTHDSVFEFIGVRGFSLPGDYNSRLLVMIDGHYLTDNVYGAMYLFGQNFGLDLELIERIEVIRGPSSALYGSNGVFATVNLVTRSPVDAPRGQASLEAGSFGQTRLQASSSIYLGGGANLLVAGSGFRSTGRTVFQPELPQPVGQVGAEQGYHAFANLLWRNWNVMAYFNTDILLAPMGRYGAMLGDPATRDREGRNFVEAAYTRDLGAGRLRLRLYYDQFRYWARYDFALADGGFEDQRDAATGDWLGSQLSYSRPLGKLGVFTAGMEVATDLRNLQENHVVAPVFQQNVYVWQRNRSYGLFTQQEIALGHRWTAYLGARFDDANHFGHALSPRAALIYRPTPSTTYKIMFGRAFRNPSTYEMFYGSDTFSYLPNLDLRPEWADTLEIGFERKLRPRVSVEASAYQYRLSGLIEAAVVDGGLIQYQDISRSRANGFELELRTQPRDGFEANASLAVQQARNTTAGRSLANSPAAIAQFHGSMPLFRNHLDLSLAGRYVSSRLGASRQRFPGVFLADTTLTTKNLGTGFDLQFGLRNLLDRKYYDPLSPEQLQLTRYLRPGRTLFVRLLWQAKE